MKLGTTRDNVEDALERGIAGAIKPKLTWEQVEVIKKSRSKNSIKELSAQYGVSYDAIWDIWNGRSWTTV